jgi:precorrin-4/cobalt-precorrin-4 C11-methyltransferase
MCQSTEDATVIRLQTGDPGLYGALIEMIQPLDKAGIAIGVVPGVTSAMASAQAQGTVMLPQFNQRLACWHWRTTLDTTENNGLSHFR